MPEAWLAWSSGKDSAWALHVARQQGEVDIAGLMTTITRPYERVSMHAVREELLDLQAEAVGLPLHKAYIPAPCSNEEYAEVMRKSMEQAKAEGVKGVVFGDLFLGDVRRYREENLAQVGMMAHFPLWGSDTKALAREMIEAGVKAVVTCVDPRKIPRELAGAEFGAEFVSALPADADPLGENGEFHTFIYSGPMFGAPLEIKVGETVEREGFVFTDILPA